MIAHMMNGGRRQPAVLWQVMAEAWLRCQGLIAVRQNQKVNVSTCF